MQISFTAFFDSSWVSLIQIVPKKSGAITVTNIYNELIPTRMTIEWRVYIDYRKLNSITQKDLFFFTIYRSNP